MYEQANRPKFKNEGTMSGPLSRPKKVMGRMKAIKPTNKPALAADKSSTGGLADAMERGIQRGMKNFRR